MSTTNPPLHRYAAALQCVAEGFREQPTETAVPRRQLEQFASMLEHIAATLLVPQPVPRLVPAQLPRSAGARR